MFKYILIAFLALTVASFGAALTHTADGTSPTGISSLKSVFGPSNYGKGAIYTDQGFTAGDTIDNGTSIYGAPPYESADDYTPSTNVTINLHIATITSDSPPVDLRVDWFSDAGGPAAYPGDVHSETIPVADCLWVDTGDDSYGRDVYNVYIPTSDVALTGGTTYWFGLQSDPSASNTFWSAFNVIYGSEMYFYGWPTTAWGPGTAVFGAPYDLYFELYYDEDSTITDQNPAAGATGVDVSVIPGCHGRMS